MATAPTVSRTTSPAASVKPALSLADVVTKGRNLPSRVIIHGTEGVGKTSFASQAPKPVVLMARGETGLETLIDNGQLSEVPHFPELANWQQTLSALNELLKGEHDFKTLILDTVNGFERLNHEHVCQRDYGGEWGKNGFTSYMQGYEVSLADWREFLSLLDAIREQRKMSILGLCHTKVTTFKNPEGADFDRYQPDMHHKTWGLTHKWADMVLFYTFYTVVEENGARAKGKGGQQRVMYTQRHAAYDAKHRHGLPEELFLGDSPAEAWKNFAEALKSGKA